MRRSVTCLLNDSVIELCTLYVGKYQRMSGDSFVYVFSYRLAVLMNVSKPLRFMKQNQYLIMIVLRFR